jgi:hypothetical protein
MKTIQLEWTGIRPLLMHNGLMVDPTNPHTIKIKNIVKVGSRKMTTTLHEQRDRLEWEGSLYWHKTLGPYLPSDNIEKCVKQGAQKSRLGKLVEAAVFVSEDIVPLQYEGPREKEELYAATPPGVDFPQRRFVFRKPVDLGIIRVRPMFPTKWQVRFSLEFDDSIVNQDALVAANVDAGALVGIGDWRPKFGRFLVKVIA